MLTLFHCMMKEEASSLYFFLLKKSQNTPTSPFITSFLVKSLISLSISVVSSYVLQPGWKGRHQQQMMLFHCMMKEEACSLYFFLLKKSQNTPTSPFITSFLVKSLISLSISVVSSYMLQPGWTGRHQQQMME